MKRPEKTFLINEEDIDTIDYNELKKELLWGESIIEAANKIFDFEEFEKQQAKALNKNKKNFTSKKGTKITANKVLNKYKNMKRPKKKNIFSKWRRSWNN